MANLPISGRTLGNGLSAELQQSMIPATSNTTASGHARVLATTGIFPTDGGTGIVNGACVSVLAVSFFQPWAVLCKLIGSRHHPNFTSGHFSFGPGGSDPFENVIATQLPPAAVVGDSAAVLIVKRLAAVTALTTSIVIHGRIDPNPDKIPVSTTLMTNCRRLEYQTADLGQAFRGCVGLIQPVDDPFSQIRRMDLYRPFDCRHLDPHGRSGGARHEIGAAAVNHGPKRCVKRYLRRVMGEIAGDRIDCLVNGQVKPISVRHGRHRVTTEM